VWIEIIIIIFCRSHVTQLLYSVDADGLMLSPEMDDPPDMESLTSSVESAVDGVFMFRGQEIAREDNMYSVSIIGGIQSRQNVTDALTSAWETSHSM